MLSHLDITHSATLARPRPTLACSGQPWPGRMPLGPHSARSPLNFASNGPKKHPTEAPRGPKTDPKVSQKPPSESTGLEKTHFTKSALPPMRKQ